MKKKIIKFPQVFLAILILLLIASIGLPCAAVQAAADDPKCWGAFVGIGAFDEYGAWEGVWDEDAEELYNEISPTWGVSHTQLIKNDEATKAGVLASLDWLANSAGPNDTVLFYISTFGSYTSGIMWVYDTVYSNASTFISAAELGNAIDRIDAGEITVILQMNNAGAYESDLEGDNRVIITSSDIGEPAWYSIPMGHSYFGKFVIDAFKNFNDADENHDFELTAEEVYAYATPLTTDENSDQHPQINDQYSGGLPILAKFACATIAPTSGSTLITLDGVDYTSSIAPRLWVPRIPHTLEVPEVINVDSGTRFAFTGWNDGVSSASRVVTHGSLQA
ncbi:MAG: hypothetical protein PHG35_01300, partial [Dehalococcoidales bacterium]|nr:hypothetical protein [Dehalococcoidales bacterium]